MTNHTKVINAAVALLEFVVNNPDIAEANENHGTMYLDSAEHVGWAVTLPTGDRPGRSVHLAVVVNLD